MNESFIYYWSLYCTITVHAVLFSSEFYFSVHNITHKPLHAAKWNFAEHAHWQPHELYWFSRS